MSEILNSFLNQLEPVLGILLVCLIIAVIALWRVVINKDKEIDRLRDERNIAVDKKDTDLKEANSKIVELHKTTLETLNKIGNEAEMRAVKEEAKTDAIMKVLEGINQVLISSR